MKHETRALVRRVGQGLLAISAVLTLVLLPGRTSAATGGPAALTATLDGRPLKLSSVADWYCDDFSYPAITCFSDPSALATRDATLTATSSLEYVTIYDFTSYQGSFMHVSQDYTVLATIGWNDRISSFIARNSLEGDFFVDWFYGGDSLHFCCNSAVPSLGSFDNSFSSVRQG